MNYIIICQTVALALGYNESGFGLFSKFAEESTCVNFEFVLNFTSFPDYPGHSSNELKSLQFHTNFARKDDFVNRFGKMDG